MFVVQERYGDGEWSDTLPELATRKQAEARLDDVEGMAGPGYTYRVAKVAA